MKIKIYLINLLLLFPFILNGLTSEKVSGYMGARNTIYFKVMPNITFNHEFLKYHLLNPSFVIVLERSTNMSNSVTISLGKGNGILDRISYDKFMDKKGNKLDGIDSFSGNLNYNLQFVSISKTYYSSESGSIAPQGFYSRLGLTWNRIMIRQNNMKYFSNQSLIDPGLIEYQKKDLFSYNIEFGSKRFFYKKFFINKALCFNIPLRFRKIRKDTTYYNIADFHESNLEYYLSRVQFFNISLGVGFAF